MQNGFDINWTSVAINNLNRLYLYLEAEWSEKEIRKFSNALHKNLYKLMNFPFSSQLTHKIDNIRRCVITRQTSIIYEVKDKNIIIYDILDNRMEY